MKRYHPKTGELFLPHIFKDGFYRVADSALGKTKHHAKNQICVEKLEDVVSYVRKGFLLRMKGEDSQQVNLISADKIEM